MRNPPGRRHVLLVQSAPAPPGTAVPARVIPDQDADRWTHLPDAVNALNLEIVPMGWIVRTRTSPGALGAAALLLAAIGVYGLMAYSVAQRTREIGVRLALGARTGQVWRMVVLQGMGLVAAGVVIGLDSASGLTRLIASFLFGVEASDPITFVAVPLVLTTVALAAVALPARRASRVDPVLALRGE